MDEEELELQRAAAMLAARSCLPRPQAALTCRAARHGHVCGGHVSVECAVAYRSRQQSGVTPFDICLRPAAPHACFTHLLCLPLGSSSPQFEERSAPGKTRRLHGQGNRRTDSQDVQPVRMDRGRGGGGRAVARVLAISNPSGSEPNL